MSLLRRTYHILYFVLYYLANLVKSNLVVAYDIITPRMRTNPGFIDVPIRIRSDFGLLLFSNLVAMTPGTLSIDISPDKRSLLVHILYKHQEEGIRRNLAGIQEKIIKMLES
jgi:multisubunit Na+/H+ antiporter MnhE subunit